MMTGALGVLLEMRLGYKTGALGQLLATRTVNGWSSRSMDDY